MTTSALSSFSPWVEMNRPITDDLRLQVNGNGNNACWTTAMKVALIGTVIGSIGSLVLGPLVGVILALGASALFLFPSCCSDSHSHSHDHRDNSPSSPSWGQRFFSFIPASTSRGHSHGSSRTHPSHHVSVGGGHVYSPPPPTSFHVPVGRGDVITRDDEPPPPGHVPVGRRRPKH